MSTTEDSSAIDEKKTDDTGSGQPNFKAFLFNYIYSILFTIGIGIFVIGGLGLYTSKVAQSDILPTDINLAPYTDIELKNFIVEPVEINIMKPHLFSPADQTTSQTAMFNYKGYLDSFVKSFICSLKAWADPKGGFFSNYALYFSKVYDGIVATNFSFINMTFGGLGGKIPEGIFMILYGLFGPIVWLILFLFTNLISIFYHAKNLWQLFRGKIGEEHNFIWTANAQWFSFWKWVFFFFFGFTICLISTFVSPVLLTIYALFSPLFAKYNLIDIDAQNKPVVTENQGVFDFIQSTFVYKKFFFFILATISLIYNAAIYLGSSYMIGIIIAIVIVYLLGLYKNPIPTHQEDVSFRSSEISNVKQPKPVEICPPIQEEGDINLVTREDLDPNNVNSWSSRVKGEVKNELKGEMKGGSKKIKTNSTANLFIKPVKKYNIKLV